MQADKPNKTFMKKLLKISVSIFALAVAVSSCGKRTVATNSFQEEMYSNQDFMASTSTSIQEPVKVAETPAISEPVKQEVKQVAVTKVKVKRHKSSVKSLEAATKINKEAKVKPTKEKEQKSVSGGDRNKTVAALLAFFVGYLGIHRFYLGYTVIGIIQLVTGGGFGIWYLIDFIRILCGTLKPKNGNYK